MTSACGSVIYYCTPIKLRDPQETDEIKERSKSRHQSVMTYKGWIELEKLDLRVLIKQPRSSFLVFLCLVPFPLL